MSIELAVIGKWRGARSATGELVAEYLRRASRYHPAALREFGSEGALIASLAEASRSLPLLLATDSRGQQVSSEELAEMLGSALDSGVPRIVVALGPANGWAPETLARAKVVVAFGRITLPHELAAVVAAEQIYRALTIRAGHPYHSGH